MGRNHFLNFCTFILVFFSTYNIIAQTQALEKGELWVETKAGLSFYNREIARINNNDIDYQEINNSLRLEFIPQINYAIANKLFIGGQLGMSYDSFEVKEIDKNNTSLNYKIGAQLQYYFLKITPQFYLKSEIGANYNHYRVNPAIENLDTQTSNYLKTYLDAGVSFLSKEDWMVSIFFKDIVTYHSNTPNFENRKDVESSVIFKDFIRFPHFSVSYRIN
ncbi:tRNA synthetase class II (D, K and N) [Mesonia algae]|uniref:tRNA synthetase class II (D, K and N) n=1 Tax=Mesonia algae TaxID=213248 RepID=A0A2W7I4B6_9FLAO|nr:amino acid--tRNA ligase-related protein [Mesonia algae]PZW41741.1 tRNA synthetase class II (D, K and N) [Mesonia algae]